MLGSFNTKMIVATLSIQVAFLMVSLPILSEYLENEFNNIKPYYSALIFSLGTFINLIASVIIAGKIKEISLFLLSYYFNLIY